ncbi:MAG: F0F1 ATP synthase subunit B [Actinomycetota bacterium]|jgi:F-type H+-transporting ATPase subunit b|nr:F0F1 ATP synthase subunit B [Actinomycetota bacterium]
MNLFAIAGPSTVAGVVAAAEEAAAEGGGGLAINFFWIAVASANFILFAVILYFAFGKQVSGMLAARRERIEQGLRDAEQAKRDRESAEQERLTALAEARREANDILARAQKVAQETRDADIAATREELERMRNRATEEIAAEKTRALGELRGEVADLALQAASRVVGESMTDQRQRRLVEEFLAEPQR